MNIKFSSDLETEEIVEIAKPEITKAVVEFRLQDSYRGEFGFDWMRIDDKVISSFEVPYYSVLETGYGLEKDKSPVVQKNEAYKQMRKDYNPHKIRINTRKSSTPEDIEVEDEYYVPYLSLFSQPFCETMQGDPYNSPQSSATLQVLVEIEEDIDRLEFKYNKQYIQIDKPILQDKLKCNKKLSTDKTITITCIADIPSLLAGEVSIYAYSKNGGSPTLAGKLQVMPNSESYRKTQKFVFVIVKTKLNETKETLEQRLATKQTAKDFEKGKINITEIEYLAKTLHQALICIDATLKREDQKDIFLDLTDDLEFKIGGKFVNYNPAIDIAVLNRDVNTKQVFSEKYKTWTMGNYGTYSADLFMSLPENKEFSNGSYFPVFYFGTSGGMASGAVTGLSVYNEQKKVYENIFLKSANMYLRAATDPGDSFMPIDYGILAHEGLHGFNLKHIHDDRSDTSIPLADSTYRYIFKKNTTANMMTYDPQRYFIWQWQSDIIRNNI